ncbi:hypothetical protein GGQ74_002002 [Desulfobaculum xiamenense]|uniref:Glycine zipper domain-containing protein n=1 Tax=Desulfobaculum xiamenense TaxID=995050 RepID=A0A846QUK9_9BACT|nr:glycine zipper domain-containing protein [Desulfobaculum xiamenense]NJB68329.1 hypothetical protein [Desulfobaculum xiamenense]
MKKIILTIALSLLIASGCNRTQMGQSVGALVGGTAGYLLGGDNAGKAIGTVIGAGAGYLVGSWLGELLSDEEKEDMGRKLNQDMQSADADAKGDTDWQSEKTPDRKANLSYTQESPLRDHKTPESAIDQNELAAKADCMCREVEITIEEGTEKIGSQRQLWCRTPAGDYEPVGEPYGALTAGN